METESQVAQSNFELQHVILKRYVPMCKVKNESHCRQFFVNLCRLQSMKKVDN